MSTIGADYETMDKVGNGALLRRENLYVSLISALAKPVSRSATDPRERAKRSAAL